MYERALYDVERNLRLRVEALEREAPGHGNPAELVDIIPGLIAARDTVAEMLGYDTAADMPASPPIQD